MRDRLGDRGEQGVLDGVAVGGESNARRVRGANTPSQTAGHELVELADGAPR